MLAGYLWQYLKPGGIESQTVAMVLNQLLFNLFAPVLIFSVLVRADIGPELIAIPLSGLASILAGILISASFFAFLGRTIGLSRERQGALVLASSFANGSLALPVCMALFGEPGMKGAMLFDLLATMPMIWIVGVLIAIYYSGGSMAPTGLGKEILKLPPVWAIFIALLIKATSLEVPAAVLEAGLDFGRAAIPLMVFVIGLSLKLNQLHHFGLLLPVLVIRLAIAPLLGLGAAKALGLDGENLVITLIAMASASPAVGIILAFRYKLDTSLYGAALTLTMLVYMILAPLYLKLLT